MAARNREITTAALVQTRTDGSGAFELETGGPIDLVAFHKGFGLTPTVSLTAAGQHVVLRFDSRGRVFLQLECGGLPLPVRTGQAEYFLVDRWKERVIGGWSLAPMEIDDVPASSYNVFVYLPGSDLYGQGVVTVLGGEMSFASVQLAPAFHAKGVVVDRSGHPVKGARLRMERSLWPPEIVSAWGTAETKENGTFDLLAGDTNEATLTGEYASSRERLRVDCGSPIRVTIESGPVK
jgi:hypothetical protein